MAVVLRVAPSRPPIRFRAPVAAALAVLAALALISSCGGDSERQVDADSTETVTLRMDVESADASDLDQVVAVVRRRLDALGFDVAEVTRNGSTVQVSVPGGDQSLLRAALAGPGELDFRPVLAVVGTELSGTAAADAATRVAELRASLAVPDGVTAAQVVQDEQAMQPADGSSTATATTPTPLNQWGVNVYDAEFSELYQLESQLSTTITPSDAQQPDVEVALAGSDDTVYRLGPVAVPGTVVKGASARTQQGGQWVVNPVLRAGSDGIDLFNEVAAQCYGSDPTCPTTGAEHGQLAIVLDGVVLSAPSINQPSFEADSISISGSFDEDSAKGLAASLAAGAAPVRWTLQD